MIHYDHLFESTPHALMVLDLEGRCLAANPAWWRAAGIEVDHGIRGRALVDVFPLGDSERDAQMQHLRRSLQRVIEERTADVVEMLALRDVRGGERRWSVMHSPVLDDAGVLLHILQLAVEVGSNDAVNAVLDVQRRADMQQQLLGIVSHDLRNPLNVIGLSAAVISSEPMSPRVKQATQRITTAAHRANRLIADLLDYSVTRANGALPIYPEPTNLQSLVDDVIDALQVAHPDRQITVTHGGDGGLVADHDRLIQVIDNLVDNALKHSTRASPITVATRTEPDAVVVDVTNAGAIDATDIARLFEPFRRGEGQKPRSAGLGLYIAAQIVNAHSGAITVEAKDGSTCFSLRLPRVSAVMAATVEASNSKA